MKFLCRKKNVNIFFATLKILAIQWITCNRPQSTNNDPRELRESNMDDLASIKVVGVLSTIFLFSLTVSNYLSKEFGLVKSPVFSLKIFSTSFVLLYFTFLFVAAKKFDTVLPSRTHSKVVKNFLLFFYRIKS